MSLAYVCADPARPGHEARLDAERVERLRRLADGPLRPTLFVTHPDGLDRPGFAVHRLEGPRQGGAEGEADAIAANGSLGRQLLRRGPFRAIYERYAPFSFAAMEVARLLRIPGILEVGAPLLEERLRHRELVDAGSARVAMARALRAAFVVVAASEDAAASLAEFPEAAGKVRVARRAAALGDFAQLPGAFAQPDRRAHPESCLVPGIPVTQHTGSGLGADLEALASGLLCPEAAPWKELTSCTPLSRPRSASLSPC